MLRIVGLRAVSRSRSAVRARRANAELAAACAPFSWVRFFTSGEKLSVASGPGEALFAPDDSDFGLIPNSRPEGEAEVEIDESFGDEHLTLQGWVSTEATKCDAGRPEMSLYHASREKKIIRLWENQRFEDSLNLAATEIKALLVDKNNSRTAHEQRFYDLLTLPYLSFKAYDEIRLGRFKDALASVEKMFVVEPNIPVAQPYSLKSMALCGLGRLDEAWEAAKKAMELHPEDKDTYDQAAIVAQGRGDWKALVEITDKINEICEHNIHGLTPEELADLHHMRATAFEGLHQWEDCIDCCDNAISNVPSMFSSYDLKARALTHAGNFEEARNAYNEILKRWSNHPGAMVKKAEVLMKLDKAPAALEVAKMGLSKAQTWYKDGCSRAELEATLENAGMDDDAGTPEQTLRPQLVEIQNHWITEATNIIAQALMQTGQLKAALETVNEALKANPASSELKDLKMKIQEDIIAGK